MANFIYEPIYDYRIDGCDHDCEEHDDSDDQYDLWINKQISEGN